jgi:hypothetical protein
MGVQKLLAVSMVLAGLHAAPVQAFEEAINPRECVEAQAKAEEPAANCVNRAQAECLQYEVGSDAGLACFLEAKETWGKQIATRMEEIRAKSPEEIAVIAGIEVKYDLQINLLQCDRMNDLTLVRKDPDKETAYSRARCEATAVGLSYVKLLLQSGAAK